MDIHNAQHTENAFHANSHVDNLFLASLKSVNNCGKE